LFAGNPADPDAALDFTQQVSGVIFGEVPILVAGNLDVPIFRALFPEDSPWFFGHTLWVMVPGSWETVFPE
jgi:hypothetical protein